MNYQEEYTPEQKLIRRECFRKRRETVRLIYKEKWELIQKHTCVKDCTVCNNPIMGKIEDHVIKHITLFSKYFNLDVQKAIERMHDGEMTQEKWFLYIMQNPPSLKTLLYLIKNNLINPDYGSGEVTLFSLYINESSYYWLKTFEIILSDNIGFNINLQDKYGGNILLSVLRKDYEDFYPKEIEEKYIQNYNEKIIYLLEKGADPLLEDKEGISPIEYARNLKTFSRKQKDDLISILERYI